MSQQAFRILHHGGEKLTSNTANPEHEFDFIGGNLALDFANTVGGLPPDSPSQDRLTNYARLVTWSQQANLTNESEVALLLHNAERDPASAMLLERARAVREAISSIFAAVTQGVPPTESDLDLFNQALEQAMTGARVRVTPDGFDWEWRKQADAFDQILAPVVRSAAALLTSAERSLVRECANEDCHWLFVDTTKNHSRRWCRTTGCGNVMRVRKHREQQHKEKSANDL
jgi:predicted RNA-binding Zn ribbon-like protein